MSSPRPALTLSRALSYAALVGVGASMLLPLAFMIATSLKDTQEVYDNSGGLFRAFLPQKLLWGNYAHVADVVPYWRFYANSVFVAALVTTGQVATCAMAAYAFARLQFPGRDFLFFGYLATMMIPGAVTMVPNFILLAALPDWLAKIAPSIPWAAYWTIGDTIPVGRLVGLDSYFALIGPSLFSAYGTFMLRQFFITLPRELEEAAELDGCGLWRIFRHVTLPLSLPALATLGIFTFLGAWGSFMWPLVVTNKEFMRTLPVGLQAFQGQNATNWPLLMAASVLMLLPSVAIFLFGQRFIVSGLQVGAVKG